MKINRNEALLLGLVALIVLFCGLVPFGLLWGLGGMMGFGMMGPGMMGGTGFFWLLLILLIVLILVGVVWLVTSRSNNKTFHVDNLAVQVEEAKCPHCSRIVQSEWKVCPYCGEPLSREGNP